MNHAYVVPSGATIQNAASAAESESSPVIGDVVLIPEAVAQGGTPSFFTFKYMNATGEWTPTDKIDVDKVMYCNVASPEDMAISLRKAKVTLDSQFLDNGKLISGEDYILRVVVNGYIGISPEDSQYWKYGAVHAFSNTTPSDFYRDMAISLAKNMSREAVQFITIKLLVGSTETVVTARTKKESLSGTYTGLVIEETEPDWILGTKQQHFLNIEVVPGVVNDGKSDVTWGTVEYEEGATIPNSKMAADFEYFWHGERGDQYRMVGFPDYVPTKYLIDPNSQNGYYFVSLHYYYSGSNEACQKSEKDITFICAANAQVQSLTTLLGGLGITVTEKKKLTFETEPVLNFIQTADTLNYNIRVSAEDESKIPEDTKVRVIIDYDQPGGGTTVVVDYGDSLENQVSGGTKVKVRLEKSGYTDGEWVTGTAGLSPDPVTP